MRYTEDSWWSACIGPCIGRLWLRPENKERVSQLLNRYRGELFSGVANAAISYNVVNISLSLASMELNYQQSRTMEGEILSIMLAGMIVGQIVFGGLGDLWGRTQALTVALSFCTVASIASACIISGQALYTQLFVLRFILGIGAGGTYPLLSVITRESSPSHQSCATMVATVFSMQGVGYLCSPLVMLLLVAVSPKHYWPQLWRWHLGLGSTLLVMLLLVIANFGVTKKDCNINGLQTIKSPENDIKTRLCATSEEEEVVPMDDSACGLQDQCTVSGLVSNEGRTVKRNFCDCHLSTMISSQFKGRCLLGTAGAWFLFDVCFYGTTLAAPEVLASLHGSGRESLLQLCCQDLFLKSLALPGYFIAIYLVRITSLKRLQIRGLLGMSIVYLLMGMATNDWLPGRSTAFVLFFSLSFFFADIGPNVTTYTLPTLVFHKEVRTSSSGISAAAGKIGALLGTVVFPSLTSAYGDGIVFILCTIVSILAMLVTHFLVEDWNSMDASFIDKDDSGFFMELESEESLKTQQ